jgi:hypothetical protein
MGRGSSCDQLADWRMLSELCTEVTEALKANALTALEKQSQYGDRPFCIKSS